MHRISGDWRSRSMKWVSIFGAGAYEHFSRHVTLQMELSRDQFKRQHDLVSLLPLWEKVARFGAQLRS